MSKADELRDYIIANSDNVTEELEMVGLIEKLIEEGTQEDIQEVIEVIEKRLEELQQQQENGNSK